LISGRDPRGGFDWRDGRAYRYISKEAWPFFQATLPLQEKLAQRGIWLPLTLPPAAEDEATYLFEVPVLPLVLYPYEWPFPLWREAALTTLTIQKEALLEGFWLRDATPFNLTLYQGKMCHFDQLSLEPYLEGLPWAAYMEFVKAFLAPLLLMSFRDRRLGKLIQLYPEGLPLDLVWSLLPLRGRWSGLGLLHLYPHKLRRLASGQSKPAKIPKQRLLTLVESLIVGVEGLKPRYPASPWEGYATESCPYPPEAREKKEATVQAWIERLSIRWGLDIGAHEGGYTRLLALRAREGVVALENDPLAIDRLWERLGPQHKHLYPIWADISQPSPPLGMGNVLPGLLERLQGRFDVSLALAITHHLRYRNLIPYAIQIELLAQLLAPAGHLIIEYIPIDDPQIKFLHSRPAIFPDHSQEAFEGLLGRFFVVREQVVLAPMGRVLYLAQKRQTL
jgi:hypothetical protein